MTAAATGTHELARWRRLGIGLVGLVAACAVQNGLPSAFVALRAEGVPLAAIGLLVSAPTATLAVGVVPARAVEAASRRAPPAVGAAAGR